jgi:hypothetical protein
MANTLFGCTGCIRYKKSELCLDEVIDQIECYVNFLHALFQKNQKRQHVMSDKRSDSRTIKKNKAKLRVIEFLKNNGKSNSDAVEKVFGSVATLYLTELRKEGLIKREKFGKRYLYSAL